MPDEEFKNVIHEIMQNAIVKVLVDGEFQGTGFFITPNGYVLTAFHCIREYPPNIVIETRFSERFYVRLDEDKSLKHLNFDIAVLKVFKPNYRTNDYMPLGTFSEKYVSKKIVAMGYPAMQMNQNIATICGTIFRPAGNKIETSERRFTK